MKLIRVTLVVAAMFVPGAASAQLVELTRNPTPGVSRAPQDLCNTSVFGRSGLDFFFDGPAQASVQVVKLCLGEPDGFNLPLYLFVGPSGDAFGGVEPNETVAAGLVNPLGGTINASINQAHTLWGKPGKHTSIRLAYQGTFKLLSGKNLDDPEKSVLLPAGYGDIGLRLQTAAWEAGTTNYGVAWVQAKLAAHVASEVSIQEALGAEVKNKFAGYSVDFGIEIDGKLNLKGGMYSADQPLVPLLSKPYWKFSFDYKAK